MPDGIAAAVNPATFIRSDAGQYLRIASHGYFDIPHCIDGHYTAGPHACADVTWFPGYPLLMRARSVGGISLPAAGLVIAWLFWYLTLLMVWLLSAPDRPGSRWGTTSRWLCLFIAAFFPGQIYFAAIFPISQAAFGMLACCYWSARVPRWALAATTGLIAGSAYLPTVAMIPGLGVAALVTKDRRARAAMCAGAGGVAVGVAAVLGYAQATLGRWDMYFVSERVGYGVGVHDPLATIATRFSGFVPMLSSGSDRAIAEQGILVALLLALALAGFAASAKAGFQIPDIVLIIVAAAGWLIPYIGGGGLSIFRDEAMTIVLVPLLRHLPAWKLAVPLLAPSGSLRDWLPCSSAMYSYSPATLP